MKTLQLNIPIEIQEIIQTLSKQYEVYFVGGCVRDAFLHQPCHDFDATTNATVDEMKEVLADFKIIDTGSKHGTLTIMNHFKTIEITTYRIDQEYLNHRTPSNIAFTLNIHEDLMRRDFTINAIACDFHGNIVDDFNGIADLNQHIIRCVGDPDKRFQEDALRILRAIRFSHCLNFEIEASTKNAIYHQSHLLTYISIERKRDELFKMLCSDSLNILQKLNDYHLLSYYQLSYDETINQNLNSCIADIEYKCASLFTNISQAKKILKYWHCSKKMIDHVTKLIYYHQQVINHSLFDFRKLLYENNFDIEFTKKILQFNHLNLDLFNQMIEKHDYVDKLMLNGKDLLELGYEKKQINCLLKKCHEYCFQHPNNNQKEFLLNYIKKG